MLGIDKRVSLNKDWYAFMSLAAVEEQCELERYSDAILPSRYVTSFVEMSRHNDRNRAAS